MPEPATPRVRDIMGRVHAVRPSDTLARLYEAMETRHVRHVAVVERPGELVGIVAHGDVMRHAVSVMEDLALAARRDPFGNTTVAAIMTTAVTTVGPDADAAEAAELMIRLGIGCLPVVADETLVGMLTESDFVRALSAQTLAA